MYPKSNNVVISDVYGLMKRLIKSIVNYIYRVVWLNSKLKNVQSINTVYKNTSKTFFQSNFKAVNVRLMAQKISNQLINLVDGF